MSTQEKKNKKSTEQKETKKWIRGQFSKDVPVANFKPPKPPVKQKGD